MFDVKSSRTRKKFISGPKKKRICHPIDDPAERFGFNEREIEHLESGMYEERPTDLFDELAERAPPAWTLSRPPDVVDLTSDEKDSGPPQLEEYDMMIQSLLIALIRMLRQGPSNPLPLVLLFELATSCTKAEV